MKVYSLEPKPINKALFKLSSFKLVPKTKGCYVLTTFNDDVLYIGLTINLNKRFKEHLDDKEKTKPTLEGKAVWFYFLKYESNNLNILERTWINQFTNIHSKLPLLNKINSPVN